ncbi:MAG: hypothetical protein Q7S01_02160 [bacterium]|nr:hypothetical protein [bacterium]
MEDKTAIDVLTKLISKYPLSDDEAEAVRSAIGILGWSTLMKGRMESMKKSRNKHLRED